VTADRARFSIFGWFLTEGILYDLFKGGGDYGGNAGNASGSSRFKGGNTQKKTSSKAQSSKTLTGETTSKKTKAATKIKRSGASVVSGQPKSGSGGVADSEDGYSADNQEQRGKGILARRNKRCACVSVSEFVYVCVFVGLCNEASTPRVPYKRHSGEEKQTVSLHPKPIPRLSDPPVLPPSLQTASSVRLWRV